MNAMLQLFSNRPLIKQFVRYFGVALVGYVFDFGSLVILKEWLGIYYLVAATVGFLVGLVVTYILSSLYVFGQSKLKSKKADFMAFALIGLIGLGMLNLIMWGLTSGLNVNYIISKVLATVVVYIWNFFARRALYHN